jgi:hypothetical protein
MAPRNLKYEVSLVTITVKRFSFLQNFRLGSSALAVFGLYTRAPGTLAASTLRMFIQFILSKTTAHNFYCSLNIMCVSKTRKMSWVVNVTRMGDIRNAYKMLV